LSTTTEDPTPKRRGLLRSSAVVASMTMVSRVLGLVRDIIFARFIGATDAADAFFVAFKIPNFLRRLFAEGAFSQAFVPVLSEYRERGSIEAVRHLIDRIAGCLGISLLALTVLVVIASPVFAGIFGLGFLIHSPEKFALTSDLLRITFPYLLLISFTGLAGAILNSYDQFAVPSFTPVFFPKVDWQDESVKKVLRLMAPAMFGVSVSQINLLLDTVIASYLPGGSVSWLYFSDRLTELPLGVFGVGIATVILPKLSRQFSAEKEGASSEGYSNTMDWALRMVLLIGLPSALALVIIAEPVLYTLFQYGKYSSHDILMASYSLKAYALGLTAFMLIKILASGYFSRQDTKTPVKIGVIAMVANMVMNLLFVVPLHFIWQLGHVGLALATSASACVNFGLLLRGLLKGGIYKPAEGWWRFALTITVANLLMGLVLLAVGSQLQPSESLLWWQRCLQVLALCVSGFLAYTLSLFATGLRLRHLKAN